MTSVVLRSTSRAEDAGLLALVDVAAVAERLDADYRLIGGHMVSMLVAAYGVVGVPSRETRDADMGADFSVVGDPLLVEALVARGYARSGASNRFVRSLGNDLDAVIDVLAPSFTGRLETNQRHGELIVDEVPGLVYALGAPAVALRLEAELRLGGRAEAVIQLSAPLPALCLKLLAWESRMAGKDATDIWRMLAVCDVAGVTPADWPRTGTARDSLAALRRFVSIGSTSLRHLVPDRAVQARIRALAARVSGVV